MTTNNVYCDRLLKLANYLDTVPEQNFAYTYFVGLSWDGKNPNVIKCGTTACALGFATQIPEFQALGVVLRLDVSEWGSSGVVCLDNTTAKDFNRPLEVGKVIFDLNEAEFEYLFMPREQHDDYECADDYSDGFDGNACAVAYGEESPDGKASAKEVANHIRFFVGNKYANLVEDMFDAGT